MVDKLGKFLKNDCEFFFQLGDQITTLTPLLLAILVHAVEIKQSVDEFNFKCKG